MKRLDQGIYQASTQLDKSARKGFVKLATHQSPTLAPMGRIQLNRRYVHRMVCFQHTVAAHWGIMQWKVALPDLS